MSHIRGRRPSPATVIAVIALFLAMGGVSYGLAGSNSVKADDIAAGAVGKSEIRKGGAGKAEVGKDSIGKSEAREDSDPGGGFSGKQIDESSLGKVPDADMIDGIDSAGLVKSTANALSVADNATAGQILTLPGVATFDLTDCDDDGVAGDGATIRITNTSGTALQVVEANYNDGSMDAIELANGASDTFAPSLDDAQGQAQANFTLVGPSRNGHVDITVDNSGAGCKLVAQGQGSAD